ncbi:MAG: ribosomal protein S18-alanine N-acetyltransferase [Oscillospiraceae bacterium]|jgi:ribosomal-protein-alanine N-acetyltransferase|nr:ribosomal protein S18-alanine N-acetyltransferase [Oscillospiraceae bacterium]
MNEKNDAIEISRADDAMIGELLAIERESFAKPWTEGQILHEMYRGDVFSAAARDAECGPGILGFVIMRRLGDEAELMKLAVKSGARRRGVGSRLLWAAIENAGEFGVGDIFLETRASNEAAIRLYEKLGFFGVGRRRDYYDSPREDAVLMRKALGC